MKVHYMSKRNDWGTPQDFFDRLNDLFDFTLDPCASKENAKCEKFYTIKEDGLSQSWEGENVFVNPDKEIKHWVKKAYEESLKPNTKVVMLIPARTDTKYWHDYIFGKASFVIFIKGRLGDAKNPSAVVVYDNNDKTRIGVMKARLE